MGRHGGRPSQRLASTEALRAFYPRGSDRLDTRSAEYKRLPLLQKRAAYFISVPRVPSRDGDATAGLHPGLSCTKSVTGIAALRSKWAAGKARRGSISESIRDRGVPRLRDSRRPIFIATLRAARLSAGCFVAHRSKTTAGMLPLRFAHPAEIRGGAPIPATDLVH